ncbi:MAG: ferritin-like domain-containing protein [Acidobacteriaceae bacterium]
MKIFSANLQDLRELYVNSLQKALDMEQQIVKTLPTMIEKSTDAQLKDALQTHLRESEGHVAKVQMLLNESKGETSAITCKVMSALATEGSDTIKDTADSSVRDAGIIAAAQQVEHHEMAVYGTLRTWAGMLGDMSAASTLESILKEEKHADILLTGIADKVNVEAETGSGTRAA